MKLKVINSNSQGNCYFLGNQNAGLLIEAGVDFKLIKQAVNFDLMKIDACTVSHEHGDHSKSIEKVLDSGIPVLTSKGTAEAFPRLHGQFDLIKHGQTRQSKDWRVTAFDVDHDVKEPLGFIIEHPETGKVLFVTDAYVLKYSFPFAFDHVIIEANYCEKLAEEWKKGKANQFIEKRRIKNHMSFQTALLTLEKMDLTNCKNIILIHLSDGLTDEKQFKEETEKRFGITTTIATPKTEIDFSLKPY